MVLWNRIQSDFNVEDETVNFGTRIIAESNGLLYEACTVAMIQSFEKVERQPNIIASIQHSKICVAIDKSITIFKDETYNQILCNISFPSMIASYCISKDSFFLFVVLTTRILYCLHLSDGKIIFTKTIPDSNNNIIEVFLKEQNEETFIILVTNTGAIYRFYNFYPKTLEIAFTNDDKVMVEKYTADIQYSELFKELFPAEFLNAIINTSSEELSIVIVGTHSIFTWPNEQYINFQNTFSFGYKKIEPLHGSSKILCLCTDHTLNIICLNTFLTLKICGGPVFDFSVIQHDNADHCEILFLTSSKDNYTTYTLHVISYPDFEQKLEINISTSTYLLKVLHTSDNLFYIEGVISIETGIIDTFKIKKISESIPEIHLTRLLRKRQFDAAEAFAKTLNLSIEPIYCFKAKLLVEQFSPWTRSTSDSVDVDILINILDKIQDIQYVIECCSKALISDYIQMKRIYSYARQRIVQNIKIKNINSLNTSLSVINDALNRLETFQMIQDAEIDTLLNDDATMKEWIQFSQANLLEEYITRLSMGQLKSATLIWTKHLPDLVKHLSLQTVQNIFTILPEDMDPSFLWPWLIHFIPTLLSLLPDAINEFISWSLKKLKYLEISHRTEWPEIGIEFAKKLIKLLKFEDNQSVYFHQEYRYQNSLLKQFMVLFQALSNIQQLRIIYRLRIPLDIYIDSPVETIYMLLDKIHIDQISDFVNIFLKQYIFNNNLQNDTVLCTYIQKTLRNSYSWWFNKEATWEKRVTIIIGFIYNMEKRLEQTLIVLKKAPVPWSSTLVTLAETSISYDHSLSFKIKIECDYVPIKLILMKYGYAKIGINNRLMSRIIKENYDSMMNDIEMVTKNDQYLRRDAFCRCIIVRLNEKNLQKAMDIIHYLENDTATVLYCYEGIINYIVAALSFQNATTSLVCHMEILGCLELKICNLLTQLNVCSYRCNNIIKVIKNLRSLYALRKYYKIDISLEEYHTRKLFVLQNYILKLLPNMKENDWTTMHKMVIKISELLGLEKSYATSFMLKQIKNLNGLEQLIDDEDLNMVFENFENTYKICLSILQHDSMDTNVIKVIKKLSISMLSACRDSDLQSILMLYTCISACPSFPIQDCFDVKQELVTQSNWKLYTIYKDQAIFLDERLLSLFKDAMFLHLYYSNQINNNKIINCDEQMDQLLTNFLENTKKMQSQHNDYSLLQIFKTFYFMYHSTSVRNEEILIEMKFILSQFLMNLLRKLCTGRLFDLQLGLSALFMLSEQEACNWLSTVSTLFQADHFRHCTISILGYEYSRLGQNQSLIQTFESNKLLHIWAQRLSHYSITSKEILTNSDSSKSEILQQIINSNKGNVIPLLKDYCCSFGLNFNNSLLLYLEMLLKTWNPTITVLNTGINKELLICKDEIDELKQRCNTIVAQMQDKSMLEQCISTLWKHISFYHYEVFIILMDLIEDKDIEKRNYLCFLQNYTRNGPPTPIEHDEWMRLNPGHDTLPPIAQWRLPFLLKVDLLKIITPELNLKTYDKWLDIAPVLNLEAYLICTLAIKGEMTQVWKNDSTISKNTWSLYSKNTTLLKDIKKCIQRMTETNSNGFYYGTAALYHVVNYTLPGVDRVAAAKECYKYAQLAAQNSTRFEEGMLEKIESKYLRFTSEHILYKYGLEEDKYLTLVENPCQLMYELYNDESIPLRYRTATNCLPDINAAIKELGKLFSLNTIKLRMDLLKEWLQSNARCTELCQSFTETFLATKESNENIDYEDNLLRICYMLEYGDKDDKNLFVQHLVSIGFGDCHEETEYSYNVRYRVFRILQTIVDTTTLEELTKQNICTLRKYIKSLLYIGKLESLGLCYNVDTFETCCKRELVQILWKSQHNLPYALFVIAQICIEFEINDISLWDNILSQMTKLRMVSDLKKVLLQLQNKSIIVNCNGYKTGWQWIISEPFSEMDINPNLEQIDNCIEAICLLYSCPVAHELDFTIIVKNCFQSKQIHLAAALLPFCNESEKKFVLEAINKKCEIKELIENLNNLSSRGVLTVTHSLAMVQKSIL